MKKGDRVVCINNEGFNDHLIIGKNYIVDDENDSKVSIILPEFKGGFLFYSYRFISLKEYRKQKLKKINNV